MSNFLNKLDGMLYGLMQWHDWDHLRQRLGEDSAVRWFVYAVGEQPPSEPASPQSLRLFLDELDTLLRRDHEESYLGILYVDDVDDPSLIKVYDPNSLGSSCGSIGYKVLPGWVISLDMPVALDSPVTLPGNRRRWWQSLAQRFISG